MLKSEDEENSRDELKHLERGKTMPLGRRYTGAF